MYLKSFESLDLNFFLKYSLNYLYLKDIIT